MSAAQRLAVAACFVSHPGLLKGDQADAGAAGRLQHRWRPGRAGDIHNLELELLAGGQVALAKMPMPMPWSPAARSRSVLGAGPRPRPGPCPSSWLMPCLPAARSCWRRSMRMPHDPLAGGQVAPHARRQGEGRQSGLLHGDRLVRARAVVRAGA